MGICVQMSVLLGKAWDTRRRIGDLGYLLD